MNAYIQYRDKLGVVCQQFDYRFGLSFHNRQAIIMVDGYKELRIPTCDIMFIDFDEE